MSRNATRLLRAALFLGGLLALGLVLWLLDVSLAALVPRTVIGWLTVGAILVVLVLWARFVVPRLARPPWLRAALRALPVLALLAVVVVPATRDRQVSESLLEGVPALPPPSATEPRSSAPAPPSPSGPVEPSPDEPSPAEASPAEPERLSTGAVVGVGHTAEGAASVYRAGGTDFVRLDLADVQGAVDVVVWLVPGADQTTPDDGVDLGGLKGTRGTANYVVPAGVDVSQYRTVLLWCRAFSTPIAVAPQS